MSFLIAFGLALFLTPVAGRIGSAAGVVDRPDDGRLKIHALPVPLLGGAAAVAAALASPAILGHRLPAAVVVAVILCFAIGLVDDVRPVPPWPRLAVQACAGIVLAVAGARLGFEGAAGVVGVLVLVLALTNAVNMLDGQDALAGGVAAIGGLGLGGLAAREGVPLSSVAFATAGGLFAFLLWNRPPARIFLGNGGAYAVGTLLAAEAASVSRGGVRATIAAALCLAVPAFELASTAMRRIGGRLPLGAGDRGHSYDLLSRRIGRGKTTAWFLLAAAAGVGAAFAVRVLPVSAGVALLGIASATSALWWRRVWREQRDLVESE